MRIFTGPFHIFKVVILVTGFIKLRLQETYLKKRDRKVWRTKIVNFSLAFLKI
jgi:hypothetical protein